VRAGVPRFLAAEPVQSTSGDVNDVLFLALIMVVAVVVLDLCKK
jgi:hypothetical protein